MFMYVRNTVSARLENQEKKLYTYRLYSWWYMWTWLGRMLNSYWWSTENLSNCNFHQCIWQLSVCPVISPTKNWMFYWIACSLLWAWFKARHHTVVYDNMRVAVRKFVGCMKKNQRLHSLNSRCITLQLPFLKYSLWQWEGPCGKECGICSS